MLEVSEGDDSVGGAFALFLSSHPGAFRQLKCPLPGEFAHFFLKKKVLMPGGWPGGMDTAGIDWRFIAGFDPGAQCIQEWEFQIRCS